MTLIGLYASKGEPGRKHICLCYTQLTYCVCVCVCVCVQGDQKVSVHLMITIQSSGAQRIFYHSVYININK
jgi:hypothetical protein